jgi:hypothetical protein
MENEITRVEPVSPLAHAAQLVQQADGKIDVGQLKELLELQERYDATQARKAYTVAMAAFKADPPTIIKDKQVSYGQTSYKHATLSNATSIINKALSGHGLTASWIPEQDGEEIKVTCRLVHIDGHSEQASMKAPPDDSGKKNPIQQIASTVSYLERYTLFAITGLAPQEDDDGAGANKQPATVDPPNEAEQACIDAICALIIPPQGKVVDSKKIAAIYYEHHQSYPRDITLAAGCAQWYSKADRPEIYVPDKRDKLDKQLGLDGDEDSQPDHPAEPKEFRYHCRDCEKEFDELNVNEKCPLCNSFKIDDRQKK